jgi:hypothetical protein
MMPSFAYAKSSTQMGITDQYDAEENYLNGYITGLIENWSRDAGYNTVNSYGKTTTNDIYTAASGAGDTYSIAFYDGEGGYDVDANGCHHYYIVDENNYAVYDHDIFQHSDFSVVFTLLWACEQGDTTGGVWPGSGMYGMPLAWLDNSNLGPDGYNRPDGSGSCFIGFNGTAPWLRANWWTDSGTVTNAGFWFLFWFYFAALCKGEPVNSALNYAAGEVWGASSFGQSVAYTGMTYNGSWHQMVVYGDGNLVFSNASLSCAMKTQTNGCFYVPNETMITTNSLKVEMLFNDTVLSGDQTGGEGISPYSNATEYPDGKVDGKDLTLIGANFGSYEGETAPVLWDYMADINADHHVDGKDLTIIAHNFGKAPTYNYTYDLSGVNLVFNTGDVKSCDANGFVTIPLGAMNFTIKQNNTQTGAMVTFWERGP